MIFWCKKEISKLRDSVVVEQDDDFDDEFEGTLLLEKSKSSLNDDKEDESESVFIRSLLPPQGGKQFKIFFKV